ncbi:2-amino-4-hydroxy-6-hydroxymethyldihydropteridine diphosphokinase [Sansalvadorimonas verongulae]|uniref:2-amino-4-hydroxy-6- hydroxymethyldihydropteridine diphosphokinase n=1 Tax=Sansalvadorimonas verongulae TaxID=2172824 RepID=UPI0018AD127D|nr:2-amino-4-hydroxy-6-hydroxymethyldihydropteridine diphosphokinase [Sansalvadorimonas verongulae]
MLETVRSYTQASKQWHYILGLGSNENAADRMASMIAALIQECGGLLLSSVCQTAPDSGEGSDYLNAVGSVESSHSPEEFRSLCKSIETRLGRVRPSPVCAADIDILAVWEVPAATCAQAFVSEPYFQPLVNSLLLELDLYSGKHPVNNCDHKTVDILLPDGRTVGQQVVRLVPLVTDTCY